MLVDAEILVDIEILTVFFFVGDKCAGDDLLVVPVVGSRILNTPFFIISGVELFRVVRPAFVRAERQGPRAFFLNRGRHPILGIIVFEDFYFARNFVAIGNFPGGNIQNNGVVVGGFPPNIFCSLIDKTTGFIKRIGCKVRNFPLAVPLGSILQISCTVIFPDFFKFPVRHIVVVFGFHFFYGSEKSAGDAGGNSNLEMGLLRGRGARQEGEQYDRC